MPPASMSSRTTLSDYKVDLEWREIFGSGIDLTECMVDILESFNMSADTVDIGLPPEPESDHRKPSPSDYETNSTSTTLSSDSGLSATGHLDRNSVWRNSSSSSSSNQSALSLTSDRDAVDGPSSVAYNRLSSLCTGSKTHFIMEEITQTEKSYIEDLRQICQGYLQPMRESSLFTSIDVSNVFGNLEEIWDFHQRFFTVLLPPDLCGPAYLANCFIEESHNFEIYTNYCTNYPTSVNHLSQLMKDFPDWFKDRQSRLGHSLQLGPYLLKPIQRILKYHLFLQKLLDSCDEEGDGYKSVKEALVAMKNIAGKINEVQRQKERKIRIEELRLLLVDLPGHLNVSDFGELLLEEVLRTSGSKGERDAFLFENGLLLVKPREDQTFLFKAYIAHCNLMLSEVIPDNPLQFSVIPFDNPKMLTVLEARNMDQKRIWTTKLKELMLKHFGVNIPDHVRQLVLQLGQMPKVEGESTTRRFRQMFNTPNAPEYLAKRRAKSPARDYHVKTESRINRERRKTAPAIQLDTEQLRSLGQAAEKSPRSRTGRPPSKEKPAKPTSVFHVSDAYIPRMKEDEFLYEETQIRSRKSGEAPLTGSHPSNQSLQENEAVYTSPRRHVHKASHENLLGPSDSPPSDPSTVGRFRGLRTALDKAYKQVLRPILKTFNSEDNGLSSSYPSSSFFTAGFHSAEAIDADCLDSGSPEDNSEGFYERDLELLDQLCPETHQDDSAVCSEGEESPEVRVPSVDLTGKEHPKLRRIYGSAANVASHTRQCPSSLRRKVSCKKAVTNQKVKSAPTTPHAKERNATNGASKAPSDLIQERIRTLEERALWRSITTEELKELEEVRRGMRQSATKLVNPPPVERQLLPPTAADAALRQSWVTMMVKKIESGVQRY